MAEAPASLDKWREFFRGANSDIFDIIKHAIMVAASDCPYDFKLNRDRIAEVLFTCKSTKCFGCDRIELALPNDDCIEKSEEKYKSGIDNGGGSKDTKESKANSSRGDDNHRSVVMEMNNGNRSCSYGDAEALTDEIEEESQIFDEVLRIKEVIDNNGEEESDAVLLDSLRRLQLMPLSLETLKATEIGKSVNSLRKHRSKDIRNIVRTLIEDWKILVDAFYSATAAITGAEVTPESGKKSVVEEVEEEEEEEEEGLPSPPLDVGAFFTTPNAMELSQFFDGMDDDGNLRNSGEFNKNRDNGRRPNVTKSNTPKFDLSSLPKDKNAEPKRNQESTLKQTPPCKPNRHPGFASRPGQSKPANGESGPGRPKHILQSKANNGVKVQPEPYKATIQKKPSLAEKPNCNNESSVCMNLEAAKRKLQERYQEAENAKRQRTIQVVEFRDLPKQSVAQRNHNMRPGNHNRHRANNRL